MSDEEAVTVCQFTGRRLLSGEIFAMNFTGAPRVTGDDLEKYRALVPTLVKKKWNRGGIIGISFDRPTGRFIVTVQELPGKVLAFRNPLGACEFYNRFKSALYGEEAVLCDPMAIVRKWVI